MAKYSKNSRGYYVTSIMVHGEKKFIYSKTIKELEDKKANLKVNGVQLKHNFGEILDECLDSKEKAVSFKTHECYLCSSKHLSNLRGYDIEDITLKHVQDIINDLHKKSYSKSTLQKVKIVYGITVAHANLKGINVINFSKYINIPKDAKKGSKESLSSREIQIINDNVDNEFGLYPFFLLYTGTRQSEALAIQNKNIYYDDNFIKIDKAVSFQPNQPVLKSTKSKAGKRNIPILNILKDKILKFKDLEQDKFIFGGEKPYTKSELRLRWKYYLNMTGLNITQHQLRHTFASILYKYNIGLKEAQEILGHSDIQTTLNIYTHLGEKEYTSVKEKLDKYLIL